MRYDFLKSLRLALRYCGIDWLCCDVMRWWFDKAP